MPFNKCISLINRQDFQIYKYILLMSKKITLGYWRIRGLGQYLRLLLSYTGLEFQQVQYTNPQKWFQEDKNKLGFDFPNLPYLIDGSFKLTESAAIARYIIKKSGKSTLLGKNHQDAGRVNNIIGFLSDGLKDIRGLFWNKDHEKVKGEYLERAKVKLDEIKNFIGDKEFSLGYLTLADFHLAENLYYFEALYPEQKSDYAFWWNIRRNFEALPQIKAYYHRQNAIKLPFIPPTALFSPKLRHVKLGYWGVRGRGQVPRLLLAYSGVEFENHCYTSPDSWFKNDKPNLGLNFPNLPYLIDGDFNITQSSAIQQYICHRWGKPQLLGKNIHDRAKIDRFLSVFNEISEDFRGLLFNKGIQTAKVQVLKKYSGKLDDISKSIGKKQCVFGYLTLADFVVAEDSYYIEAIFPSEYKSENWSFLQRIRKNLNSQPQIVAYYKSQGAFKGQFMPPMTVIKIPLPFNQ